MRQCLHISATADHNVPEICVVTTLERLLDDCCSHGLCETSDGQVLPAASLRRMLCDAVVYPTVLGGAGEVLDSGRARRTVNRKQRRALRAMHRTCGHPGCTVPFESCRIHHVRWWTRDNGPTDIANLLPLCEAHHHLVHEGGWTLDDDTRPGRHLDPTRRHRTGRRSTPPTDPQTSSSTFGVSSMNSSSISQSTPAERGPQYSSIRRSTSIAALVLRSPACAETPCRLAPHC